MNNTQALTPPAGISAIADLVEPYVEREKGRLEDVRRLRVELRRLQFAILSSEYEGLQMRKYLGSLLADRCWSEHPTWTESNDGDRERVEHIVKNVLRGVDAALKAARKEATVEQ